MFSDGFVNVTFGGNNYYEGHIKSGKRSGFGNVKYANGDRYQGFWENDLKEGEGTFSNMLVK